MYFVHRCHNNKIINSAYTMKHSKTTEALLHSIEKIKSEKRLISDKLSHNIAKNQEYFDNHTAPPKRFNLIAHVDRERSIDILSKKLIHKKKMDEYSDIKLVEIQTQNLKRKQQLERRLDELNNRNAKRIQELRDLQQNVFKKIHEDIQKNETRERHLQKEYHRIQSEEKKVSDTRHMQANESERQWKILQKERVKLQSLAQRQEENQRKLISDKSQVMNIKQDKIVEVDKSGKGGQYSKFKSVGRVGGKQVSPEYLQQLKLMQRENMNKLRKQNQKTMLDINIKMIGYTSDIMERISRNTSNLSQFDRRTAFSKTNEQLKEKVNQEVKVREVVKENKPLQALVSMQPQPVTLKNNILPMPGDDQTQNYLRQIKMNLTQLQTMHEKTNNPQSVHLKQLVNTIQR